MELKNTALNSMKDNFIDKVYLVDASNENDGYQDYTLTRVNNDVYGNPMYKLNLTMGDFKHSSVAHRNYSKREYYLLQSYNIKDTLDRLFQDLGFRVTEIFEQ